jgi:Uncharacterized protein conserved in bacteria
MRRSASSWKPNAASDKHPRLLAGRVQLPATAAAGVAALLDCASSVSSQIVIAMSQTTAPANAEKRYTVSRADLPLSCPTPEMALWNSHPRVYLPIDKEPGGECACPYCGAVFVLVD